MPTAIPNSEGDANNMQKTIEEKQRIEIEYWRNSLHESPEADSIHNIVNKMTEAAVFLDCIRRHQTSLPTDGRILELGGGQGWAACIYKKIFPDSNVTTTDISSFAIESLSKWERILNVKIDNSYACKSYETEEKKETIDLIFCFAAAHHFLAHKKTIQEISRILKPGGKAIYFYEPATPRYLYSMAHKRVNRKRPEVPEDVLISHELQVIAKSIGLGFEIDYYPSFLHRRPFETFYFYILKKIPFIQKMVPCTANFIFVKMPKA
jgi:SAM-dependent methyltransferase